MLLPFSDSDLPIVSRTPVSRRKIIEKQKSDLQESDSSDSETIQIKTKTIRTNQNYSDDSSSSSNTNEHDIAFFQNEFQSSENIGDSTEEADGNSDSENTILADGLPNQSVSPVMPRRSTRSRKPPDRFGEWVS